VVESLLNLAWMERQVLDKEKVLLKRTSLSLYLFAPPTLLFIA
jgi:hypothetical protein